MRTRRNFSAKTVALTAFLFGSLAIAGCGLLTPDVQTPPPAPCGPTVQAIRYQNLVVSVSVNYSYTAQNPTEARPWHQEDVIAYLNELGSADGNTFAAQNGNPVNFYFTYTINNDGQNHFTGSLDFSGWGQGHIHTFYTQYSYTDTQLMTRDLTKQAYEFISEGWHDSRPSCQGS